MRLFCLLFLFLQFANAQNVAGEFQKQVFHARDRVLPALVHVEPIKQVYTRGEKQSQLSTGSGVIFSKDGHVMTNHHVAGNAEKVWCTLANKERITATVVGSDPSTDIAVLKLNLSELKDKMIYPAPLGQSTGLEVGQIVLALGSPLGLSRSVSMGVVSSIDRYFPDTGSMISPYNLWIQTDAAINPGNSGGPLINLDGDVVGINARAVFMAENLGFAIPIDLAREVADEIIKGSSVTRSWIGADFQEIKGLKEYMEKPDFRGVLVSHVDPNSPAAKAGLRSGDVVQKIGDEAVHAEFEEGMPQIRKIISSLPINKPVKFSIWRNQSFKTLSITTLEEPLKDEPEFQAEEWGVVIKDLSWNVYYMQLMEDFKGVFITSVKPGSVADEANLRHGDVIRSINGETINNSDDIERIYAAFVESGDKAKPLFVELLRSAYPWYAVLKPISIPGK
ncbi:MAG: trypsin-like peptidase domain-containing protein [Calditrichia bacterium]